MSKTVLSILGLLGNIIDPTTVGTSDSTQALKYDAPRKEDGK
ncbi:phage holin [Lysinibacillus fusiformis]|nr:phage holin [Lysinibacillus fusiformis]